MTKANPDNLYDQQFDDAAGDAAAADYGDAYYDDAYDGAYDDEVGGEDAAAAGAAGAGAGAAAAGTGGGGGGAHAKKGGLPLRGLAMVLIAVAVMLGLWGLYAMTSEDDDSTVASDSEQSKSDGSANGGQEGNGTGGSAADGARGDGSRADGSRDGANNQPPREGEGDNAHPNGGAEGEANRDAGREDGARGEDSDRAGDEARAGGNDAPSAARDRNDIKVSVLNNSGESDKAKNEADVLKDGGFKVGYVGNLPGDVLTVPKTTVFYPEGDTSAESLAKEVAARYQAEVKPMNRDLPKEATEDGAVVVALAVPQA